jgi:hypothetical protein
MEVPLEVRIIDGALKIISDPNRWTRGAFVKDANGWNCKPRARQAVRFCGRGALSRAAYEPGAHSHVHVAFDIVRTAADGCVIEAINDYAPDGRQRIIAIFKKALKRLR